METEYRKRRTDPLFLQVRQASTRGQTNSRRLRPKLDERGRQTSDACGICKDGNDVMIKDAQPRRPGSAGGSVVEKDETDGPSKMLTRSQQPVGHGLRCNQRSAKNSIRGAVITMKAQGRVSSDLQSRWTRGQARDAYLFD
jgi:hypothetical protein